MWTYNDLFEEPHLNVFFRDLRNYKLIIIEIN
jgi:hypothetical protein